MRKITKYHKGLLEVALNHIGRGHLRSNLFLAREAKGCQLWDVDGNEYLDFTSGIGVLSTGHCHPKIVKAVQTQVSHNLFNNIIKCFCAII